MMYIAYVRTPTFIDIRMILNMRTLTSMLVFSLFSIFKIWFVIVLYCLQTYCYKFDLYFFGIGKDRFFKIYICSKDTLSFNFHRNNIINTSPCLRALANLGCQ